MFLFQQVTPLLQGSYLIQTYNYILIFAKCQTPF